METKRKIYVFAFTVLGLLLGFLVHAILEIIYLKLLLKDFVAYSFGLSWSELIQFHNVSFSVLIVVCGLWGFAAGKYWWQQIYVLKRLGKVRWLKVLKR